MIIHTLKEKHICSPRRTRACTHARVHTNIEHHHIKKVVRNIQISICSYTMITLSYKDLSLYIEIRVNNIRMLFPLRCLISQNM